MIENNETESKSGVSAVVIGIVVLLCCICVLVAGMAGYGYYAFSQSAPVLVTSEPPTDNPLFPVDPVTPENEPEVVRPPVDSIDGETLQILETTVVPPNEPKELACRMEGKCDIPDVMATTAAPRVVGDTDKFWVTDVGTNENSEVQATLRYVTPHVYFWVQDGVSGDSSGGGDGEC